MVPAKLLSQGGKCLGLPRELSLQPGISPDPTLPKLSAGYNNLPSHMKFERETEAQSDGISHLGSCNKRSSPQPCSSLPELNHSLLAHTGQKPLRDLR